MLLSKSGRRASTNSPGAPDVSLGLWVEAARPKTLGASVVPVLAGTAAAGAFDGWRFVAALVVGLCLQIGVNFANDVFDAARGVDTGERLGPRRLTSAGLITPRRMKVATAVCMAIAAVTGAALALAVDLRLLIVGLACVVAALAYSGGKRPYGGAGFGEVAVFVFFGLVATAGSAYVQAESVPPQAWAASVPVGLLAAALLLVNNLRDVETDGRAGKRTLAVRIGQARTRKLYRALVYGAFVSLPVVGSAGAGVTALLPLAAMPLARPALIGVEERSGSDLVDSLVKTARLQVVFGLLLAAGLLLRRLPGMGASI